MDHHVLADKCLKAMGNRIPMAVRERWGIFIREERTEFKFRYEWIKDSRFYQWVYENSGSGKPLDICDGQEWFGIYICNSDGSPLNDYGTL